MLLNNDCVLLLVYGMLCPTLLGHSVLLILDFQTCVPNMEVAECPLVHKVCNIYTHNMVEGCFVCLNPSAMLIINLLPSIDILG